MSRSTITAKKRKRIKPKAVQALPRETPAQSLLHETPVTDNPLLIAYRNQNEVPMKLVPAPVARTWINATDRQFAKRCLPMLMSNQAGWFILSSHTLLVTWDGGDALSSLQIECLEGSGRHTALSHFGHGILTWRFFFALGILAITVALLQGQPAPTGHFIPFVWPTSPPLEDEDEALLSDPNKAAA